MYVFNVKDKSINPYVGTYELIDLYCSNSEVATIQSDVMCSCTNCTVHVPPSTILVQ